MICTIIPVVLSIALRSIILISLIINTIISAVFSIILSITQVDYLNIAYNKNDRSFHSAQVGYLNITHNNNDKYYNSSRSFHNSFPSAQLWKCELFERLFEPFNQIGESHE